MTTLVVVDGVDYLSSSEACRMLGIGHVRLGQLIAKGTLEAIRLGHVWFVAWGSVKQRLAQ